MDKYKIDYSKWDRMEDSDDDENEDRTPQIPKVTVFDQPTRVTFGGTADIQEHHDLELASSSSPSSANDIKSISEAMSSDKSPKGDHQREASPLDVLISSSPPNVEVTTKRPIVTDKFGIPLAWTENGASVQSDEEETSNQKIEYCDLEIEAIPSHPPNPHVIDLPSQQMRMPYKYVWSQDRMMIHIRIPIPLSSSSPPKLKYHVRISNLLSIKALKKLMV